MNSFNSESVNITEKFNIHKIITEPKILFSKIVDKILVKYKDKDAELIADFNNIVQYLFTQINSSALNPETKKEYIRILNTIKDDKSITKLLLFISQEAQGI